MRFLLKLLMVGLFITLLSGCVNSPKGSGGERLPNVVIIFTDDMGYGDLGVNGNPTIKTPNIDALAMNGCRLSQFYVAAPVCTPSRAALLTGSYPKRVGLHKHVLFPHSKTGPNPDTEMTIAKMLKQKKYHTAIVGKWHLGHKKKFLPLNHGFDYFYGIPYSNDMSMGYQKRPNYTNKLPVFRNNEIIAYEPDQNKLTKKLTEEAVAFIERSKDKPFFLYMIHPQPHIPLHASKDFQGRSLRGKYGDSIEEIDWSVGQVMQALQDAGVADNTLVVFASDNGPWKRFKTHGGSAGPFRGGKGETFEGGMRVPGVVYWPGKVPAGTVCSKLTTTMDLLPTIAYFAGIDLDLKRKIDGVDISSLMLQPNQGDDDERPFFYYSSRGKIEAVRKGSWKYNIKTKELHNLHEDISEQWDLAQKNSQLVQQLTRLIHDFDARLTREARPVGTE